MNDPSLDRDPFEGVAESFLARYRAGEPPPASPSTPPATPSWPTRSAGCCRPW